MWARACGSAEIPSAILKARAHRSRSIGTVTVNAVVGDKELRSDRDCTLVTLVRISQLERIAAYRKSGAEILVVRDEAKTVTAIGVTRCSHLLGRRSRLRIGISAWRTRSERARI